MSVSSPVIVALDFDNEHKVLSLVRQFDPSQCRLKVGKQLFTAMGPRIITQLHQLGFDVFLDLKFHDIPNTVEKAVAMACQMNVWMVNVHALGGAAMLQAARAAVDACCGPKPLLIGVTLLTSWQAVDCRQVGLNANLSDQVVRLARLVFDSGLDGVVCSAEEVPLLRSLFGDDFLLVTPGIRLAQDPENDQRRVMTPQAALSQGSDYLVMGRSITQAASPVAQLEQVNALLV
jgi:orotidine-5'-phosphate decarboxylase